MNARIYDGCHRGDTSAPASDDLWKGSGRILWDDHWQVKRSRSILNKRECVSIVEKSVLVQRGRCHLAVMSCMPQDSSSISRFLLSSHC